MLRCRALLAFLLVTAWCSAAYHEEMEAVGLLLSHEHLAHHGDADDPAPPVSHDDHEPVIARELVRDLPFFGGVAGIWFVLAVASVAAALTLGQVVGEPGKIGKETGPPRRRIWQFIERCALESAAPPVRA